MTVGVERTVLVAKPHRPPIGRGKPRVVRLRISESGARLGRSEAGEGTPLGVYYRSLLRRTFVAVIDLDGGVFFLDLIRKQEIRIDEKDVDVALAGCLFKEFTIVRDGRVLYGHRYVDLSRVWKDLFFDQLEDADLDFFSSTRSEKRGGFANMRRFLSALAIKGDGGN